MEEHDVEQGSNEWFKLRAGTPTASNFSMIVSGTGKLSDQRKKYARTLAGERCAGQALEAWAGNQWTDRGKELEPRARAEYSFVQDEVREVGFVTNGLKTMGCSPDGLVGKDGLVEFKCLSPENHIAACDYFNQKKVAPPAYISQIQGQLLICERDWCDLLFYHPILPNLGIRVWPDTKFQQTLLEGINEVIAERDRLLDVLANVKTGRINSIFKSQNNTKKEK
jgi:hypothetical protein